MKVIYLNSGGDELSYEVEEVPFDTFPEYVEHLKKTTGIEEYTGECGMGLWIFEDSVECIHEEGHWKYLIFKE